MYRTIAATLTVTLLAACDAQQPPSASEPESPWVHVEDLADPVVWEQDGINLEITRIAIGDPEQIDAPGLPDDATALVGLEMSVSNDSGAEISWHPVAATIHVLREQVDSGEPGGDQVAGNLRDGVDDSGQEVWVLTDTPLDDVLAAGELTWVSPGPWEDGGLGDRVTADDIELTVHWAPQ